MIEMTIKDVPKAESEELIRAMVAALAPSPHLPVVAGPFAINVEIARGDLTEEQFAEKYLDECERALPEVELTGRLMTNGIPLDQICWLARFPSGAARTAYAHAREKGGRTVLAFEEPWALIDPEMTEVGEGNMQYQITLLALGLPDISAPATPV